MSMHVCPGDYFIIIIILDSRLADYMGKKLSFWLSGCSVLIEAPLL